MQLFFRFFETHFWSVLEIKQSFIAQHLNFLLVYELQHCWFFLGGLHPAKGRHVCQTIFGSEINTKSSKKSSAQCKISPYLDVLQISLLNDNEFMGYVLIYRKSFSQPKSLPKMLQRHLEICKSC